MSLTDIVAGIALVELAVYGTKGLIYALKYHKNTDDQPSQYAKTFCKLPAPIDDFYFIYSTIG